MHKIKEAIIVEGTYDQIKLSGFVDGVIVKTNGFTVYKDKKKLELIKKLAQSCGIVILTDSDAAGFRIRNFIKQYVTVGEVKNAYIPEIFGKEKRKSKASAEGLLGVEGVSEEVILRALINAGCEIDGQESHLSAVRKITKTDLYMLGLSGGTESAEKRRQLCLRLGLPTKISANMLLSVMNRLMSYEQLAEIDFEF